MNCCTVLLYVLSSILLAETKTVRIKKIKDPKNVTTEAQHYEMQPWDYDTISSNLSDHSTLEPTTEEIPTILMTPAAKDETSKSVDNILDNNPDIIDTRRFFNWLKRLLSNDQAVTTTEDMHEVLNPEVQSLEDPIVIAKVLTDATINLTKALSKLTAILQTNGQATSETPIIAKLSQIPNNNVQFHRMLKKSYVFTPLENRRMKRDLSKPEKNLAKENDTKSGINNINNGTNNATNTSIDKSITPPSNDNDTTLNDELQQTHAIIKSNETSPSYDTSQSETVESSNDVNLNNMSKIQTRRNANLPMQYDATERIEIATQNIKKPQSEIKSKMLSYITDTFSEIEKKIKRVKGIKRFVTSDYYKQGYLMANVDALETNAAYLKKDLDYHKEDWDEKSVLDAFDKVTITSKALNNLIESLDKIK